ncbi:glycine--tRNA ligase subunit beta [bacterium]|nr:glycine--tRNA ligase subunit beta [bacterium]
MDFLWEIGCEELPPHFIPQAIKQLKEGAEKLLNQKDVSFSKISAYGTPRRLVLYIEDIAPIQKEKILEIKGPPYHIAFDDKGNPTQSAFGFARSQGVNVDELIVKEDKQGKYVYALKKEAGRPTGEILKEVLPELFSSVFLPKSMRWDASGLRFIRPVRWLLALLGNDILELRLGDLLSSNKTYLERYLKEEFTPKSIEEYFEKLREVGIVLEPIKRREIIINGANELAESVGGEIASNDELLEKVTFLNEKPRPFLGRIDERFLHLPKEVIITAMQSYLNLFPIVDEEGKLLPYFVGVRDGDEEGLENVIEGYEEVLKARLADAHFFFEEDLKVSLEERSKQLNGIIFLGGLGTIADKVERMISVISSLSIDGDIKEKAIRVARLCRADLTTNMVKEFPDLQGIIGRCYALLQGEEEEVASAIYESYQYNLSPDGIWTPLGRLISLVDKMDTLVGAFNLGLQPTGSSDPFALRRACQTVIDILRDEKKIQFKDLLEKVIQTYTEKGIEPKGMDELREFIKNRIGLSLRDMGIRYDIVNAVLAGELEDIRDVFQRALALEELRENEEFIPAVMASVRLINILRQGERRGEKIREEVKEELLLLPEEKELYEQGRKVREKVEELRQNEDYKSIFLELSSLKDLINRFFDKVLVMTEDDELRANRLALVNSIWKMFFLFGDLSQIVIEG